MKETFASSKEARVGVSPTGHSRSTSPVRRFDRIWFDCQPVFEIHTALDFKYPSYRGRKAGYQRLMCVQTACVWNVADAAVASLIVWWRRLVLSLMQQCDESRNNWLFGVGSVWISRLLSMWTRVKLDLARHLSRQLTPPTPPHELSETLLVMSLAGAKARFSTSCYTTASPLINGASIKVT